MALRRGFKAEANRIALTVRSRLRLEPASPLDPWAVCEHFEIEVIRLSELTDPAGRQAGHHFLHAEPEAFSAVTLEGACRRVIVHNDAHRPVRQRSNLAHELAHCFLGHPLAPVLRGDGGRNRGAEIEEEAAFLGGSLLITNEAAHHIVASGLGVSAAAVYGVSRDMLAYRLRVSGATIVAGRRAMRAS